MRWIACGKWFFSIIAISFYPFHPNEPFNTPANKMNIIIMGIGVVLFFLAIIFGIIGNNNWFRYFSIGLIILFFVLSIVATKETKFSLGGAWGPLVGYQERSMMYGYMLWLGYRQ